VVAFREEMNIEEILKAIEGYECGNDLFYFEAGSHDIATNCPFTADDLKALAKAFRTLHDTVKRYANEDAWTGQFSKDGRQDLWLYGEGKATAVKALKELE